MLITKETDYALRILRALASGEQLTAADISNNEQVPQQFAYKIMKKLQKAGIIRISRGPDGGCALATDLSCITLLALMQAMEENSALSSCMKPGYQCNWCEAHGDTICQPHIQLSSIQDKLERDLESYSLKKILFG